MGSRVRRGFALRGAGLKRDLIQQTAYPLLALRVLEGVAAWVLFNQIFFAEASNPPAVDGLVVVYFLANAFFCLQYRAGQISRALVLTDLGVNVGTMTLLAGFTGGVNSPVVLICLIKIAGYGFIFSPQTGAVAITATLVGFTGLVAGELAGWWSTVPMDALSRTIERRLDFFFRVSILGVVLIGGTWLLRQVAEKERQLGAEARRAKQAADRERAAASVTRALLSVSEAVNHLTRLDDVLNKVVDVAPRVLGVDYCGILLWSEESTMYRGAAVSGVEPTVAQKLNHLRLRPADVPDIEWVRGLGHCAVVAVPELARRGIPDTAALLAAPLFSGGRFYGVVHFARRGGRQSFTQRDLTIADGVAGQTAIALERARLVEESRRLVLAVESAGEAVLITDRHGRIVFANEAFLQIFGYTREEIVGRDSTTLGSEMTEEWLSEVRRTLAETNWRGEAVARRKDGSTFPVGLNTSLIRGEDGRIQGAVAIMQDSSAQKKLEEQLHRADRLAAAGELAAGVAHEVNNALVGILGQVESTRGTSKVGALRSAMARVDTQGRRIAEIVQGLLGFARPQTPQRGPVDLRDLVRSTLTLMAHDLGRSRIRNETRFAVELPAVFADSKQIQQVLVNLFTNAAQAMEPCGGGVLGVDVGIDGNMVCLNVQDTGVGISSDALPRVFDPFFSTKPQGTGLGLSVSYAIVQAHGGELTVRTTPGEGTVFTLRLPAVVGADAERAQTVLLVDDDVPVADTLAEMLAREGLTVRLATTGAEALDILTREIFDAIFLDVRLPDISGQDVYARLAAERPDMAQRVVFVTGGLWRVESGGLREKLPPQPTLSKPCTAAQIRDALRLLRHTRAAA
ncbi:MAG: ATP-binding protein [Candidatus Binatia bacterium]